MEQQDTVLEALKKYRKDLTQEDLDKFQKKLEFEENRINRYIERIHNMSKDERSIFINKCIDKYTSDEYIEKEYKRGWEPRCPLYDILIQYAVQYGIPAMYKQDNDYFPEEQYDIDGKFVITAIHGQGTIIYIDRVPEDEIIPHILEEYPLTIFNNKDEKICETSSESTFIDILIQLKYKKLSGYYVIHKGKRFEITKYYKVMDRNFEFGRIYGDLLRELMLGYSNEH